IREHAADVGSLVRPADGAHLAVVERREQLEQLVVGLPAGAAIIAERLRAVSAERSGERLHRRAQAPQFLRIGFEPVAAPPLEQLAGALDEPRLAARRPADKRDELIVDEQRAARELLAPAAVDVRGERIVELRVE